MGLSPGFTVLIVLPAFLLHTSGLYIASSVGEYSTVKRGQCLYSVSDDLLSAGLLKRSLEVCLSSPAALSGLFSVCFNVDHACSVLCK